MNLVKYDIFDLKAIFKKGNYDKNQPLIVKYEQLVENFQYFGYNIKNKKIFSS
jgi:hypothetical protein